MMMKKKGDCIAASCALAACSRGRARVLSPFVRAVLPLRCTLFRSVGIGESVLDASLGTLDKGLEYFENTLSGALSRYPALFVVLCLQMHFGLPGEGLDRACSLPLQLFLLHCPDLITVSVFVGVPCPSRRVVLCMFPPIRISLGEATVLLTTLNDLAASVRQVTEPLGTVSRFNALMKSLTGATRQVAGFLDTATHLEGALTQLLSQGTARAVEQVHVQVVRSPSCTFCLFDCLPGGRWWMRCPLLRTSKFAACGVFFGSHQVNNVFTRAQDTANVMQLGVIDVGAKLRSLRELLIEVVAAPRSVQDAAILTLTTRDALRSAAALPAAAGVLARNPGFLDLPGVVSDAVAVVSDAQHGGAVANLRTIAAAAETWSSNLSAAITALQTDWKTARGQLDPLLASTTALSRVAGLDVGPLAAVSAAVRRVAAQTRLVAPEVCAFSTQSAAPLASQSSLLQFSAEELARLQQQLRELAALGGMCEDGLAAANSAIADQVEAMVDRVKSTYLDIKLVAMRVFKEQVCARAAGVPGCVDFFVSRFGLVLEVGALMCGFRRCGWLLKPPPRWCMMRTAGWMRYGTRIWRRV
jgi:hypothetical protein